MTNLPAGTSRASAGIDPHQCDATESEVAHQDPATEAKISTVVERHAALQAGGKIQNCKDPI